MRNRGFFPLNSTYTRLCLSNLARTQPLFLIPIQILIDPSVGHPYNVVLHQQTSNCFSFCWYVNRLNLVGLCQTLHDNGHPRYNYLMPIRRWLQNKNNTAYGYNINKILPSPVTKISS